MRNGIFSVICCLLLVRNVNTSRYCLDDTDCTEMGDLICVKAACAWGYCGCARGFAARFVGSDSNRIFKCVALKRIGQSCNEASTRGVCAASNSECHVDTKTCRCKAGFEARFDGEICVPDNYVYPGETASASMGIACQMGSTYWGGTAFANYEMLAGIGPMCRCGGVTPRTVLLNYATISAMPGAKIPTCTSLRILIDLCIQDTDCPGGSTCLSDGSASGRKVCKCATGQTHDISRTVCALPQGFGVTCFPAVAGSHCDGALGLRCGDTCETTYTTQTTRTCKCDPSYVTSGSVCSERALGVACFGDYNCKGPSIGNNGICVDGECESGATHIAPSIVLTLAYLVIL